MKKKGNWINLTYQLSKSFLKIQNENSNLGLLWQFISPFLMLGILYVVFKNTLGADINNYLLYTLLGLIIWNFIGNSVSSSIKSIYYNSYLIKSLYFRKELLIVSNMSITLIASVLEIIMFIFILLIMGISISYLIIFFPLLIILLIIFCIGIGLALSSLYIYFRDIENIWSFFSKIWWFATPIFYSVNSISPEFKIINVVNPMYYFVDMSRDLLIYSSMPRLDQWIIVTSYALISFVAGIIIFHILSKKFSEKV